jgi:hypothetical protein
MINQIDTVDQTYRHRQQRRLDPGGIGSLAAILWLWPISRLSFEMISSIPQPSLRERFGRSGRNPLKTIWPEPEADSAPITAGQHAQKSSKKSRKWEKTRLLMVDSIKIQCGAILPAGSGAVKQAKSLVKLRTFLAI